MDIPTKKQRTPVFRRAAEPPGMRLTERDKAIIEAVYSFEVLGDYQLRLLFFTGERQCRDRLSKLYQHGYLERPERRRRAMLPCMVYWLTRQGAALVAAMNSVPLAELWWRKEPLWSKVEHDLAVNDVRITTMVACARHPALKLEQWIAESEFWARPDTVKYKLTGSKEVKRKVRPDGYFVVRKGDYTFRYLLELDQATEDNPRFGREKVLPGIAYLNSPVYLQRFGYQSGRWLVVVKAGERRLRNLKQQTEQVGGEEVGAFYFTTFAALTPETMFTRPIWWRGGEREPTALFNELR